MMRRRARRHDTVHATKVAGLDPAPVRLAQPGDRVVTVDGPGVVVDVYDGPFPQSESYQIMLDDNLGGGEYSSGQVLDVIEPTIAPQARRYSQTPMACDDCGSPASTSVSGGKSGHTMLCDDCREKRRAKNASSGEEGTRTAARADLPLLAPDDLKSQGAHTAADDYPQLSEILWERPDLVEAVPVAPRSMPRRLTMGSKQPTSPTDTGEEISRVKAAEIMYGTGSPQHLKAIERWGDRTAATNEPVWLKERRSNPVKDSLNDKNQPWWWRKVVGPAVDRYNDSIPPNRQIKDQEDLHRIDSPSWCRFRRKGDCYFPKDFDEQGSKEAGYAVWIPYHRGECPWKSWDAQKHDCKVSEPGPKSGEVVMYPDATVPWSQGGQRVASVTPVTITRKYESSWVDVREKAKRIRQSGGVRVIAVAENSVTGEVRGDTGLYTATVTLVPGSNQVALASCSCPWETYRWARSGPWKKLEGRACAHITALLYEMQSRKMFGGEITEDASTPEWRTEQPALENPKSRPGPWRLDVAASAEVHRAAIEAQREAMEARAAVAVHLDPQVLSLGLAVANLGEGEGALVSLAKLTEARSLIDIPPFYAQVSGEIVIVDGFDEDGVPWVNGRALSPRQLMYPTFHPTRGITGASKGLGVDWYMPGKKRPFATSTRATSDLIVALGEDGHTVQSAHDAIAYDPEGKDILAAFMAAGYVNTLLADLVGGITPQDQVRKASLTKVALTERQMETLRLIVQDPRGWHPAPQADVSSLLNKGLIERVDGKGKGMGNSPLWKATPEGRAAIGEPDPDPIGTVTMGSQSYPLIETTDTHYVVRRSDGSKMKIPLSIGKLSKTAAHSGCMIALVPSPELAAALSVAATEVDGLDPEPADQIHVTMAYLGKAADVDKGLVHAVVQGIAAAANQLVGRTSGWGTFDNGDENVLWASLDVPGLDVMRTMVLEAVAASGLPIALDHGFTPHMTVGYSSDPITSIPTTTLAGEPLVFDAIVAVHGSEWTYFNLLDPAGEAILGETKTSAKAYTHAGLVIKAADSGRVLMTQRTPYHADDEETSGAWEFPGGSIEDGEDPWTAAVREFGEETGLSLPEGYRIEQELPNGTYVAFLVTVPHESWTVNAELLPLETMGIGWFDPDHVEDSPLTRPEVDETDWEMVKEAASPSERIAELTAELAELVARRPRNYKTQARKIMRAIISLQEMEDKDGGESREAALHTYDTVKKEWVEVVTELLDENDNAQLYREVWPTMTKYVVEAFGDDDYNPYTGLDKNIATPVEFTDEAKARAYFQRFAAKTAVSTQYRYHLTSKVDFKLDPKKHPDNNTTLGGDLGAGIFLSPAGRVEHWLNGYGYWRPWVVEIDLGGAKPDPAKGGYAEEEFYSATEYSKMRIVRVLPLDAFCREQFGAWGWVEEDLGIAFDTGKPIAQVDSFSERVSWDSIYPFRGWTYSGDARNESSSWQQEYAKKVRAFGRSHGGVIASIDVEAEAEAILHEEPQPALPEALGTIDSMEPDQFGGSFVQPNSISPRNEPSDDFEPGQPMTNDPVGVDGSAFVPGDARLAWIMESPASSDNDDIALAAQAALAKMALKTFSIEEQHELINEGESDHRGARNTDRLSIAGTHYEYGESELEQDLLW